MVSKRLHADATLVVTQNDNLMVASWKSAPTVEQVRILSRYVAGWRATRGEDVAFVNVVAGGKLEDFSAKARDETNRMTERFPRNICSAHVVLVSGLPGMLARTILRAMALVGRHESPWRVFDSCAAAAAWMTPLMNARPGRAWTVSEVLATLNS